MVSCGMQMVSRRGCALAALAVLRGTKLAMAQKPQAALVQHPRGEYSFLPAIPAYSSGVVARDGHEIVHATFSRLPALRAGFKAIDEHLTGLKLPKTALCAVELRLPRPLSLEDFGSFNNGYIEVLKSWGIMLDGGRNPVARTNVAPVAVPPAEPAFHGFSYTMRSNGPQKTFVVAGSGELGDLSSYPGDIVRLGDTSPAGIAAKSGYVMEVMAGRLRALGVTWPDVSAIDVYTAHDLSPALVTEMLTVAGHNAFVWNYARPPIKDIELEMDVRGVRREIVLG
jgi:hypothetical protein